MDRDNLKAISGGKTTWSQPGIDWWERMLELGATRAQANVFQRVDLETRKDGYTMSIFTGPTPPDEEM